MVDGHEINEIRETNTNRQEIYPNSGLCRELDTGRLADQDMPRCGRVQLLSETHSFCDEKRLCRDPHESGSPCVFDETLVE